MEENSWWGAGREFPNHSSYISDINEEETTFIVIFLCRGQ